MPNPNNADDYEVTYTSSSGDIINTMDYSPQSYVFDPVENSWVIRENLYKPPTLMERYKRKNNKEFGIVKFMRGENV